jgi:alcohol dehydrogenase class IV
VLLSGAGSLGKLPDVLAQLKIRKVLIVTDGGLMKTQLPDRLLTILKQTGIHYVLFDGVRANPTTEHVEEARRLYAENSCQAFLAFGGGSPIDTAKAAAARIARPRRTIPDMRGFLKVGRTVPPIVAIPTTAGTGSEVTIAAVITNSEMHYKYAVSDPQLIPVCAVLDPELTAGLPPMITACTGMDALTHAVEAYITHGAAKRCKILSEQAVRLIYANIEEACTNGGNLEARLNMLMASFYAGDSFTRAGLTYVHPIAHALGGLYNKTHGLLSAVLLPYVLEAFGGCIHSRLARLAVAAGLDAAGMTDQQAAAVFIESIRRLNRKMNIPDKLGCIRRDDIPQIVKRVLAEANPWYPVPKIFGENEITRIVHKVSE